MTVESVPTTTTRSQSPVRAWFRAFIEARRPSRWTWAVLAMTLAVWATHAVLRAAQLGRPAPYGAPFVEKFEWYFFHAVCYDALWSLPLLLPAVLFFLLVPAALHERIWARMVFWVTAPLQGLLLFFSVMDHEFMRYMAVHGNIARFQTWLSLDSVRESPNLVMQDAGGFWVPFALGFGGPVLCAVIGWALWRWFTSRKPRLRAVLVPMVIFGLASWLFLFQIWKGTFRLEKLKPLPASLLQELKEANEPGLSEAELAEAKKMSQQWWLAGSSRQWVFVDDELPYWRMTVEDACQSGAIADERCKNDADGDGFASDRDCNDQLAEVYPGAEDLPGNGLDEDCDGIDERPWNVLLILMESHRALNVGHLQPYGARAASTPRLDELAASGKAFARHQVTGVPTIEGFFTTHCSVWSKGRGHAATDHTDLNVTCLPNILSEHGYQTRYFAAAAPDWDNQTYWLARWYDDYDFDRDRQTDLSMFRHMADWMNGNLSSERPFFITAITKSNHYPFNAVHDMTDEEKAKTPGDVHTSMHYADRSFGELLDNIRDAPWFDRTIVMVTADHGVNWGENGYYSFGDPLHRPSTWLPLVIAGDHPELNKLDAVSTHPTTHADLMPTVLDLLGIERPNAMAGHSLLDPAYNQDTSFAFSCHYRDLALEKGGMRTLVPPRNRERPDGDQLFDVTRDFHLDHDVGPSNPSLLTERKRQSELFHGLIMHTLRNNRLEPASDEARAAGSLTAQTSTSR